MPGNDLLAVRNRVRDALNAIADRPISDVGIGCGTADIWLRINGREYYVTVGPSMAQLGRDAAAINAISPLTPSHFHETTTPTG